MTGAAGGIGSVLRRGLDRDRFDLRSLDRRSMEPQADDVRRVDLRDVEALVAALTGVDAVVHLAALPHEGTFEQIHDSNVVTTHHVYEAARRCGIRRVVFASSVHVYGFWPWGRPTTPSDRARPDTFYALSKLYGEHLGQMYADRHGIEVVNLRIVGFSHDPDQPAFLWGWLSPADTVRLVDAALTAPITTPVTCHGVSANRRRFLSEHGWAELGYGPQDDAEQFAGRWPHAVPPSLMGMEFTEVGT